MIRLGLALCWFWLSAPLSAQIRRLEIQYKDSGCASCAESLEARLKRLRGVERVAVDPAKGSVVMELAVENRVAIGQVRDFIEQGGSRVHGIQVVVLGKARREDGAQVLEWEGARGPLRLEGKVPEVEGRLRVTGTVKEVHPGSGPFVLVAERFENP